MLFHATPASCLASIRRRGLLTGRPAQWVNAVGAAQGSRKHLYLVSDFQSAVRLAHRMQWGAKESVVVLALDADPKLEADDHWENSANGNSWWKTTERIPPTAITRVIDLEPWLIRRVVKGTAEWPPVPDALDRLDGCTVLERLDAGDLDSEDVGDFYDRVLAGVDDERERVLACEDTASSTRDSARAAVAEGRFRIWRTVVVPDAEAWAQDPCGAPGGGLGLCWSLSSDGALPYGGPIRGTRCTIVGEVGLDDVDWNATAIMQAVKPEQEELRLHPKGQVAVLSLSVNGHLVEVAPGTVLSAGPSLQSCPPPAPR